MLRMSLLSAHSFGMSGHVAFFAAPRSLGHSWLVCCGWRLHEGAVKPGNISLNGCLFHGVLAQIEFHLPCLSGPAGTLTEFRWTQRSTSFRESVCGCFLFVHAMRCMVPHVNSGMASALINLLWLSFQVVINGCDISSVDVCICLEG